MKKSFADLKEAKVEAYAVAAKVQSGQIDVLQLHSGDRTTYRHAISLLKPTSQSFDSVAGRVGMTIICRPPWLSRTGDRASMISIVARPKRRALNPTTMSPIALPIAELLPASPASAKSSANVSPCRSSA